MVGYTAVCNEVCWDTCELMKQTFSTEIFPKSCSLHKMLEDSLLDSPLLDMSLIVCWNSLKKSSDCNCKI